MATSRGLPTFSGTDQPNGPAEMNALAAAVDAMFTDTETGISHQIVRTAAANIPTNAATLITTGWADTFNISNSKGAIVYNAGQLLAPVKGIYEVDWTTRWDTGPTSPGQNYIREVYIAINGSSTLAARRSQPVPAALTSSLSYMGASDKIKLNANDAVQLGAFQSSTATIQILEGLFTLTLHTPLP